MNPPELWQSSDEPSGARELGGVLAGRGNRQDTPEQAVERLHVADDALRERGVPRVI
jgi:hypothetical protein